MPNPIDNVPMDGTVVRFYSSKWGNSWGDRPILGCRVNTNNGDSFWITEMGITRALSASGWEPAAANEAERFLAGHSHND